MFRRLAGFVLLAGLSLAQTQNPRLDQIIQSYVSSHQFMGSVLLAKDGQIVLDQGYGFANL
ncbi:MAG: serine hydrolase, partial [Bryobacteraceae bacterium]